MDNDSMLERTTKGPGLEKPQGDFSIDTGRGHEWADIRLGPIVKPVIAIVVVAIITHVVVYVLYAYWIKREQAADRAESPVVGIPVKNEDPKLLVDEDAALANYHDEMATKAEAYKWVDQNAGVAQIPVERAMEIVGQSGKLPAGEAWSLRPGEQMVGGVIMTPEQVQYANTPPSQAPAGSAPAPLRTPNAPAAPAATPAPAERAPAAGAAPARP